MFWANAFLVAAGFSLALAVGGGFYESIIINPQWSAQPPATFSLIRQDTGIPLQKFWIPAHIAITILMIAALAFNWRMPARRALVLVALGSYVVMRVWSFAYFIPEMLAFQNVDPGTVPTADLAERVARWKTLTYWRTPLDIISFCAVLWALTLDD